MAEQVKAHSIIIATGATAKKLGIPSEEEFWNNGISACAVCDGASSGFRQQELAVVGGGDTAAEEALYLTKYGSKVGAAWPSPSCSAWRAGLLHADALRCPVVQGFSLLRDFTGWLWDIHCQRICSGILGCA